MLTIPVCSSKIPFKVQFTTLNEKKAYITAEFRATNSARTWRYECEHKDLAQAIEALANAQLEFARARGYTAHKYDKYLLVKQETEDAVA